MKATMYWTAYLRVGKDEWNRLGGYSTEHQEVDSIEELPALAVAQLAQAMAAEPDGNHWTGSAALYTFNNPWQEADISVSATNDRYGK